jgi:hypothetical protein
MAAPAAITAAMTAIIAVGDIHAAITAATAAIVETIMIVGFNNIMPSERNRATLTEIRPRQSE